MLLFIYSFVVLCFYIFVLLVFGKFMVISQHTIYCIWLDVYIIVCSLFVGCVSHLFSWGEFPIYGVLSGYLSHLCFLDLSSHLPHCKKLAVKCVSLRSSAQLCCFVFLFMLRVVYSGFFCMIFALGGTLDGR